MTNYRSKLTEKGFYLTKENVYVRLQKGVTTTARLTRTGYIRSITHTLGDVYVGGATFLTRKSCEGNYERVLNYEYTKKETQPTLTVPEIEQLLVKHGFTREVTEQGVTPFTRAYGLPPADTLERTSKYSYYHTEINISIITEQEKPALHLEVIGAGRWQIQTFIERGCSVFEQVTNRAPLKDGTNVLLDLTAQNIVRDLVRIQSIIKESGVDM